MCDPAPPGHTLRRHLIVFFQFCRLTLVLKCSHGNNLSTESRTLCGGIIYPPAVQEPLSGSCSPRHNPVLAPAWSSRFKASQVSRFLELPNPRDYGLTQTVACGRGVSSEGQMKYVLHFELRLGSKRLVSEPYLTSFFPLSI